MRRRELLKGLTTLTGGALALPGSLRLLAETSAAAAAPLATAVRALVEHEGRLLQPIDVTLPETGGATGRQPARVKVDGREVEPLPSGAAGQSGGGRLRVLVERVTAATSVTVTVESAGRVSSAAVALKPVREVLIYMLPHSHHDLGYTDPQADVEEKQMRNITRGMELAEKTAAYPAGARFVWNLEVLWGADLFLRRRPERERASFVEAVRKGHVALNGSYANELTGLCRPEELLELFRFGTELGERCGVPVRAAMMSDVPGATWGTVTAMAQAGIRYFSSAPNYFDRIGTLMVEWQDRPFWWVSPSGRERVLLWVPWTGYALSHVNKLGDDLVAQYQERLDAVGFPYSISYARWSGHGDNAEPDPELSEWVRDWNAQYAWPRFHISSTAEAFAEFERRHGAELPEHRGDLTPYWEDGAGSSALETRMSRNAADRLTQAETLGAMLGATAGAGSGTAAGPGQDESAASPGTAGEAWRDVLLYSEHTWGAWSSVSDAESPFAQDQWRFKRALATRAERRSEELLRGLLRPRAGEAANSFVVHNTCSWTRSEVVVVARELSAAGDRVRDARGREVPSQRLQTGELAVLVDRLPGLASTRFSVSAEGEAHGRASGTERHGGLARHGGAAAVRASAADGLLENGRVRVRVDLQTGDVVELRARGSAENLAAGGAGGGLNRYLYLAGADVATAQTSGRATVTVEETGPLVASLRMTSTAPGCRGLVRTVRLCAGAGYVELSNTVDKERAPANPQPGKDGPGGAWAQRGGKESVQFGFPFAVPRGTVRVDVPLAVMQPEADQLAGACKNWLPVGRWVDVANDRAGVTWVTLDAPLIELGELSANLLGSQRDPAAWRRHIEPSGRVYSWAMNNHWGTNYRAYQEGVVEFRYALRPHAGYDAAEASRLATGLSQPLLVGAAQGTASGSPLLRVDGDEVLVTVLRPSRDGRAWMVRLYGASGAERRVRLHWREGAGVTRLCLSDTAERAGRVVTGEVEVAGWEVVTLRAERG